LETYLPGIKTVKKDKDLYPIVISNHYTWMDIFYFVGSIHCPCFLSKASVAKLPLYGNFIKL